MLTRAGSALAAFTVLCLLLACTDAGVRGSADLTLFRWSGSSSKGEGLAVSAQSSLIQTSWLAEDIGGRGVIDNAQTTITFDGEGRVAGSGGCNRYFGSVAIDGAAVTIGKLGSTQMACVPALMDQERKYFDALAATRTYRLDDTGHKLVFLGEDGTPLVRFSRSSSR
ncbi:MAG: META domain-containing protein [Rhodospirillales bacterium]|nr:META domain-containing protein [Rhodospirillales bacterium]